MEQRRIAEYTRKTKETDIYLSFDLDGRGDAKVDTEIGFFDHMLDGFARHGLFDLNVKVTGDLVVDCHHTIEDTGIVLGNAIKKQSVTKRVSNVLEAVCFPWMRHWCFVRWIYQEDRIYPLMQNLPQTA